jgi:DNA-binding IscR family transcriptional regulator
MKRDSRLSVALHVLMHMSEIDQVATSETLGALLKTNPVVFRRTMAGLRKAGIVRSEKGHGGGWLLARKLDSVTLAAVYEALALTTVFSIGPRDPRPRCPLEQAVNRTVGAALGDAEALLLSRLAAVTVADMLSDSPSKASPSARKGNRTHA